MLFRNLYTIQSMFLFKCKGDDLKTEVIWARRWKTSNAEKLCLCSLICQMKQPAGGQAARHHSEPRHPGGPRWPNAWLHILYNTLDIIGLLVRGLTLNSWLCNYFWEDILNQITLHSLSITPSIVSFALNLCTLKKLQVMPKSLSPFHILNTWHFAYFHYTSFVEGLNISEKWFLNTMKNCI